MGAAGDVAAAGQPEGWLAGIGLRRGEREKAHATVEDKVEGSAGGLGERGHGDAWREGGGGKVE